MKIFKDTRSGAARAGPKNIVITGASSGLGAALATHYAAPGVTLHLQGRNHERLERVANLCQEKEATVYFRALDVTDKEGMRAGLPAADAGAPVDLVIANAGISAGTGGDGESEAQARNIFATNVDGVLNTVQRLLFALIAPGHGQVALMSSLAGIRALPSSPAYSASKACVRYYGEALRGWLCHKGVEVCVVCPGYIKTPMTDVNDFPMPFIMQADQAAARIAQGLSKNRARIAFPRRLYWPLWWLSCLSPALTDPVFSRLPGKPSVNL